MTPARANGPETFRDLAVAQAEKPTRRRRTGTALGRPTLRCAPWLAPAFIEGAILA